MKLTKSTYSMAAGLVLLLTGCSEYTPNGYTEGPILPTVSSISYSQIGASNKNISISWTLPSDKDMTGCSLYCDGTEIQTFGINSDLNYSYDVYGVPLGREVVYTVKVKYTDNRLSTGKSIVINLPADTSTKIRLYLLPDDAPTAADLSDDDEKAAAAWFAQQPDVKFIHPSEIANCDPKTYSVMWIEIDRVGLPHGWENLPGNIAAESTITALRQYLANGGNLYLSNMATQLTVPLGIVPDNMAPTVFGNGEGGSGDDVWVINPYLGWDFRNGSDQGFY
ncbi:MAG: DUF4960 domain-containing protein, partial [Muribaculaceae bacterium]|nr:DUF4960 domain-containing protein [Muribaculaceae bacterium]